jgi:hypothetical protein
VSDFVSENGEGGVDGEEPAAEDGAGETAEVPAEDAPAAPVAEEATASEAPE